MAWRAEFHPATNTEEECDTAAVVALPVAEFVAMKVADFLTKAQLLLLARWAHQVLLLRTL